MGDGVPTFPGKGCTINVSNSSVQFQFHFFLRLHPEGMFLYHPQVGCQLIVQSASNVLLQQCYSGIFLTRITMTMLVLGFSVLGTKGPFFSTCQINLTCSMTAFFYMFCYCNRFLVLSLKLFYHMSKSQRIISYVQHLCGQEATTGGQIQNILIHNVTGLHYIM